MSRRFGFVGRRAPAGGLFFLVLALLAVPAFAQTDSPDASGAAGDAGASGAADSAADSAGESYGGPAPLSREFSSALGGPQMSLTPYVEITGIYDSGLEGITVNSQGSRTTAAMGTQYTLGLSAAHTWRHTRLGFNYSGSASRYFNATPYNNSNQALSFAIRHTLSRHTVLSMSTSGGIFSLGFAQPTVSSSYQPALDIFGNRSSMFNTQIGLLIQKTARLSFGLSGSGGLTHQTSSVVYDIGSVGVSADAQYRLTPRTTAGVSYSFYHFMYPGSFTSASYHSVGGSYAVALSRRTEISVSAGFMRSGSSYYETLPLDPLLAFLIGSRSAVVIHREVERLPSGSGRITRSFARGSASFSGGYTVIPGNGLFLATVGTTLSGSYSYTGFRQWTFSAGGNYSHGKSIGTALGYYGTSGASLSASRQIGRITHAVISFSAVRYDSVTVNYYNRLIYQARIGLGFSPGSIPLGPR